MDAMKELASRKGSKHNKAKNVQLQGAPVGLQGPFHPPLPMDLPPPANIALLVFAGEQHLLHPYRDPATKKMYLGKGEQQIMM